ncbi:T-cell surface glycoprotein CD1a-like isoform X6 [Equus asinus]|nr:T-cell surface glycoprotein CD1a-like isoform X3 [Equus asinus]XP_044614294.1 T-cell surface glycoprotein CD1a-like isoform X3 [Equus asinus]XP_044614295.1 T-cell surface glycoprotein CD1a-like isoform X3 [Equus asinus]XP_044614296.1 T-cell surface glycoprotein CD1a-like isoform X3 [Equus asinus]XP_044614297.1 T-cell surface glycoprotein CD1a-like isoform X3 [Equus asinus]
MLFLQLALLVVLPDGDSKDGLCALLKVEYKAWDCGADFQEPTSFRVIYSSSFYNPSRVQALGSAWLGELQTHGWENHTGSFIFLRPWSKGNFSSEELTEIEKLFHMFNIEFNQIFHNHASQWQLEYPFQVQLAMGCELHIGEASVGFARIAYQGSDLISIQNNSWLPSPKGGSRAQQVSGRFNLNKVFLETWHRLLTDTCPRFLLGLVDAGKADLQRQARPEAWLSTGPSPAPGHLMLVCHVSSFYPKPIWVMWMRGKKEQQGTQQSDILPNADGTWYLRKSLDVEAIEADGLSCRVRHSSLEDQDIILYWEHRSSTGWIFLAVIVPLVLLTVLAFWLRKRWTRCEPPSNLISLE